jgi:hypothetical protein
MQPTEPEEDLKELVAREHSAVRPADRQAERVAAWRREHDGVVEEPPETDWLRSNAGWVLLGAILAGLAGWIVYIALR